MILAASTVELMLRMLVSLAIIGAFAFGALRVSRRRLGLGSARPGISIHARHQLTRTASVAVVRAGDRYFLLGVTDHGVNLLAEGGPEMITPAPDPLDGVEDGPAEPASGSAQVRAGPADGSAIGGAGKRHGRAVSSVSSGMSVIEALREKTVRRR